MNLTKSALRNDRVTILIVLIVAALGITGYFALARNSMPPFTIRVASVVSRFPGASPDRVEELVTERIERLAQEIPEVKTITSESRTGLSIVNVELRADVDAQDMQPIWDRLRRKIEDANGEFPQEVESIDLKDEGIGTVYGIQLGLSGTEFSYTELEDAAESLRDELVKLPDAAEVEIVGAREQRIYVNFDNARLARYGLSAGALQQYISSTNIVFPGGDVSLGDQRITLEPTGNFEELADLQNVIIPIGNPSQGQTQTARLGEITEVTRGYVSPPKGLVRIDGMRGLAVAVALKDGANLIELGEQIDANLPSYRGQLPIGMELERIAEQDAYVAKSVNDFIGNVLQSVAIVLAVMFLFLGWRSGLVVASLIPLSILMTLLLMNILGYGLNQVSLAALIMALGLLVDNAIVVSENILVRMEEGMTARNAAVGATQELAIPLLISSLTTSAAFLAFYLADNVMGEMMGPLFVVISLTLLSSWIMAMTVIPMLSVYLIRVNKRGGDAGTPQDGDDKGFFARFNRWYSGVIKKALRVPALVIGAVVALFVLSAWLFTLLPFIFFPDSDRNLVTMDLNLPLGTKIERTTEVVAQIEEFIERDLRVDRDGGEAGIVDYTSFVGEGPASYDLGYQPGEANSGYAHLLINTSNFEANDAVIRALEDYTFQQFPLADVSVGPLANGGGGGADVDVRVSGPKAEVLFQIKDRIRQLMNENGATGITDDWGPKLKKVVVDVDQDRANRAGVSNQDVAVSLRTALSGFNAGSYREEEDNIPIMMIGEASEEYRVQDLSSVNVFAQSSGNNVPLAQVADVDVNWQYSKINRRDLYRTLTVSCDAPPGQTAAELTTALRPGLDEMAATWPNGYAYNLGGEDEQSSEAMAAVINKLPLVGFIILLLLMLQFNSFRKTSIVLSTIPLGLIGVSIGLLVFRSYFGFMAFLGLISLAGILINNAIVLIDRIQIERDRGLTLTDAIIEACRQRFRPILLTTFTTALGLIPLYLGGGLMWEPMAVSIMIGLLFATVITLLFVPALYLMLYRKEARRLEATPAG